MKNTRALLFLALLCLPACAGLLPEMAGEPPALYELRALRTPLRADHSEASF